MLLSFYQRTPLDVAAKSGYSVTAEHFPETGPPQVCV